MLHCINVIDCDRFGNMGAVFQGTGVYKLFYPSIWEERVKFKDNNNNNYYYYYYYLQFGRHPVAKVIVHSTLYMHGL